MVCLRLVERLSGGNFRDDGFIPKFGGLRFCGFRSGLLLCIVIKNHRAVLRAHIVALAIERGRVVNSEKDIRQRAKRDDLRVESDLHDLRMATGAAAHFPIRRIQCMAAHIAAFHAQYAFYILKNGLYTPKTAASEGGSFCGGRVGFLQFHALYNRQADKLF